MTNRILIIAGPNGAGKTTFAKEFLPNEADMPTFLNADLIAAGISPLNPEAGAIRAGRILLQLIDDHAANGQDFAFETTLSARTFLHRIKTWQSIGYQVGIIFLWLPNEEIAIERVIRRVQQGGHSVPHDRIRQRFRHGLRNFEELYKPMVDFWTLIDNSGSSPIIIGEGRRA
ncbi:MAG TPA: zeta toxin family protein [Fimbriimonadaceae bacterium]|nr:zeta toxin family protein [Fimbriimonadaceae bacterium]